mgnify:CR=1 FL=1
MIAYYRTDDSHIHGMDKISDGVWIHMVDPSAEETAFVAEALNIDYTIFADHCDELKEIQIGQSF